MGAVLQDYFNTAQALNRQEQMTGNQQSTANVKPALYQGMYQAVLANQNKQQELGIEQENADTNKLSVKQTGAYQTGQLALGYSQLAQLTSYQQQELALKGQELGLKGVELRDWMAIQVGQLGISQQQVGISQQGANTASAAQQSTAAYNTGLLSLDQASFLQNVATTKFNKDQAITGQNIAWAGVGVNATTAITKLIQSIYPDKTNPNTPTTDPMPDNSGILDTSGTDNSQMSLTGNTIVDNTSQISVNDSPLFNWNSSDNLAGGTA